MSAEHLGTFMPIYILSSGSPYYNKTDTDNGMGALQECLVQVQLSNDVHILLSGDLNVRTSNTPYEGNSSFQLFDVHCHEVIDLLTRNFEASEENVVKYVLCIRALYCERCM